MAMGVVLVIYQQIMVCRSTLMDVTTCLQPSELKNPVQRKGKTKGVVSMNDEDRVGFLIVAHVCIFHFNYALASKLTVVFLPIENHQTMHWFARQKTLCCLRCQCLKRQTLMVKKLQQKALKFRLQFSSSVVSQAGSERELQALPISHIGQGRSC